MAAMDGLAKGSISEFLLDSRNPGGSSASLPDSTYAEDEARREKETDRQVEELLKEAHIWRVANSAQWVAWGIVQAKVPELDAAKPQLVPDAEATQEPGEICANGEAKPPDQKGDQMPDGPVLAGDLAKEAEQLDEPEDEFDYLGYAQERAMFFWGDVVRLGLVRREELPEKLVQNLKIVEY